jgi:hypothetical protein
MTRASAGSVGQDGMVKFHDIAPLFANKAKRKQVGVDAIDNRAQCDSFAHVSATKNTVKRQWQLACKEVFRWVD